ncbi:hypothetical protein ACIRVF_33375 [Kitasatospora sp. NPDC101157]|uniref:hypothetical protein n=1 Tax=Kitasatospora sp. NPDC101157 TaxID=3364098 RepID=UPI0038291713
MAVGDDNPIMRPVVIFDWLDGPREGFARLETRSGFWWYFRTLATRFDPDDVDQCLYAFSAIPADDASTLEDEFKDAENRSVVWPGRPGEVSIRAAEAIERVAADVQPPSFVGRVVGVTRHCEIWEVYTRFGFSD